MTAPIVPSSSSPRRRTSARRTPRPGSCGTWSARLVPVIAAAAWFFGVSALLVVAAAALGALLIERVFGRRRHARSTARQRSPGCCSGSRFPPGMPLWMAFLGGAFGIGFGKVVWGGLGQNVFNPALVGRAFLQAAFPVAITTWPTAGGIVLVASRATSSPSRSPVPVRCGHLGHAPRPAQVRGEDDRAAAPGDRHHRRIGRRDGGARDPRCAARTWRWKRYLNWRIPASILLTVARAERACSTYRPRASPTRCSCSSPAA